MRRADQRADVIVIGAGVAGLACAADLHAAGLRVRVLEAADQVGGRMRSDRVDGFLVDRGFQVFNTAYPQVRRRLELKRLRLRPFSPGAAVHTGAGRLELFDPTRRPSAVPALLTGGLVSPRDLMALGGLSARDMLAPASWLKGGGDRTTRAALRRAGFSAEFTERFFRPFLSGIFLEDDLETSSRFFHLVWRSMLRGTLCLPTEGIEAVPRAMAAELPEGTVRLQCGAKELTDTGAVAGTRGATVVTDAGERCAADAVVVATGPSATRSLLPGMPVPPYRTVTTYYHVAPRSPLNEPTLLLDERRRFLNTCVLSEVVPSYAPGDAALVATSVLGADEEGHERAVRAALSEVYGTDTAAWHLLVTRTIAQALPAMRPRHPLSGTSRVTPGVHVCGDHRATGSVQGAMASGARAAREVLHDLHGSGHG
ncbi:NAD(P)/FAD-dependent oxidoreductase [Streptomyces sp. NPDC102406]|uniref:NAD(P)/FAD-dependent oxidoreductase n=1 Tax=Streptomyces sp. NPDC102406 TaxID=3366171 RepID=UPI003809739D